MENIEILINNLKNLEFLKILNNDEYYKDIKKTASKLNSKYDTFVIIGFGGSYIAAKAILDILKPFQNKVKWITELNQEKIDSFLDLKNSKTAYIFISKSGETIEVLSILEYFFKKQINSSQIYSITSDRNNSLRKALKNNSKNIISHLEIEAGRYSFTTNVCFLILDLIIDSSQFRSGLRDAYKDTLNKIETNAYYNSFYSNEDYQHLIFFVNDYRFESFNLWLCQLFSESLSKGKLEAIFPITAIATRDQHSMLESYANSFLNNNIHFIDVNISDEFSTVRQIEFNSMLSLCQRLNIPYKVFQIENLDEYNLGKVFMQYCLSILTLAFKNDIDPFTQPRVDLKKKLTLESLG